MCLLRVVLEVGVLIIVRDVCLLKVLVNIDLRRLYALYLLLHG